MAYDCSTDWTALPAEEPPEHLRDYNNRIFHAPSFKFQFWMTSLSQRARPDRRWRHRHRGELLSPFCTRSAAPLSA